MSKPEMAAGYSKISSGKRCWKDNSTSQEKERRKEEKDGREEKRNRKVGEWRGRGKERRRRRMREGPYRSPRGVLSVQVVVCKSGD